MDLTTARVPACGTSVITPLIATPSIQQMVPINKPGKKVFAITFQKSKGFSDEKILVKNKDIFGGVIPSIAPRTKPDKKVIAHKITVRQNTDTATPRTRGIIK